MPVLANGGSWIVVILAIDVGIVLVVGGSAVWLAVVRGRGLVGLVGISAALLAWRFARFPLSLSLTVLAIAVVFLSARPDSKWVRRKEADPSHRDRAFFFPPLALLMVAVFLVVMASIFVDDGGPSPVEEEVGGATDRDGVILTFDVLVLGDLPEGTPLEGRGVEVRVFARDTSSGGFSSGVVIDDEGQLFHDATDRAPGPFSCDESTCRARMRGLLAGVPGEALEYSIRATYVPDRGDPSPPELRIEVTQVRAVPVKRLSYEAPLTEDSDLIGAMVQLSAERAVADPPFGWFEVQYAEVWQPDKDSLPFGCLAYGCEQATEVLFSSGDKGLPASFILVKGWLAGENAPILTVMNQTRSAGAVTVTASSVVDEYRVTIDHPSRDIKLPLLVDLRWAGEEFGQFRIDGTSVVGPLSATAFLADICRGTSCSFAVGPMSSPTSVENTPSELIVTVIPWETETDSEISILINQ